MNTEEIRANRSLLPPHDWSPFRSCSSLRSGWSPFGGTFTPKTTSVLGAPVQQRGGPPSRLLDLHHVPAATTSATACSTASCKGFLRSSPHKQPFCVDAPVSVPARVDRASVLLAVDIRRVPGPQELDTKPTQDIPRDNCSVGIMPVRLRQIEGRACSAASRVLTSERYNVMTACHGTSQESHRLLRADTAPRPSREGCGNGLVGVGTREQRRSGWAG